LTSNLGDEHVSTLISGRFIGLRYLSVPTNTRLPAKTPCWGDSSCRGKKAQRWLSRGVMYKQGSRQRTRGETAEPYDGVASLAAMMICGAEMDLLQMEINRPRRVRSNRSVELLGNGSSKVEVDIIR
jgi:hypothetical protein